MNALSIYFIGDKPYFDLRHAEAAAKTLADRKCDPVVVHVIRIDDSVPRVVENVFLPDRILMKQKLEQQRKLSKRNIQTTEASQ